MRHFTFFRLLSLQVVISLFVLLKSAELLGQGITISESLNPADPSAILDLQSDSKGLLIPRMTASEREAINSPADGLIIFQTDNPSGLWYCENGIWAPVSSGGTTNELPDGASDGDILYWNTGTWNVLPVGLPGQHLILSASGSPIWSGPTYPEVTTASISNIGGTIALSGGNVIDTGDSPVTQKGVCWSTNPTPTTSDFINTSGNGLGAFTTYLSGLQTNMTYYVRAFATNSVGTSYGPETSLTTLSAATIAVGETYAGGIICYIDGSGQHGLIVSQNDLSTGAQWGCYTSFLNGTSLTTGSGAGNTNQIINTCGQSGIAARLCNDYSFGGYSDWFLPSRDELAFVYSNLYVNGIGNFLPEHYWTSSEEHSWSSWFVRFSDGYIDYNTKDNLFPVRAIRTF